jgi:hypothetical protein
VQQKTPTMVGYTGRDPVTIRSCMHRTTIAAGIEDQ